VPQDEEQEAGKEAECREASEGNADLRAGGKGWLCRVGGIIAGGVGVGGGVVLKSPAAYVI
jgi:hypothetical protein